MNIEILLSDVENRLLPAGSPRACPAWYEFREVSYVQTCDLTSEDIPALIETALKWSRDEWFDDLDDAGLDEEAYDNLSLLPVTAWRALAELKAVDCAGSILSMLDKSARNRDDWSLDEFPYVLGALGSTIVPLLVDFADQTSNDVNARIVPVEALSKIAVACQEENGVTRDQVIQKFNAWLQGAINKPVGFESNRDAQDSDPIRFNSAVLDGLLKLQAIESAELIERAFAANQLDVGYVGDWNAVRKILNVEGLGLEMPKEPVNSIAVLRSRLGFGVFSNKRLFEDGDANDEALQEYLENAIDQFADSDEGKEVIERFGTVGWVHSFLQYAARYLGETVDTLTCNDAREIVFEIIPRKVSTQAESAEVIIFELRKFWEFVDRVHVCPEAKKIVKLLDNKAVRKLRSELSNPANFGMAKSMFMSGMQAGFDMTTQEGLDRFLLAHNAQLARQRAVVDRFALTEPPMQRVIDAVRSPTRVMSATERKAFDKKRKKQLAAKLNQKKNRK